MLPFILILLLFLDGQAFSQDMIVISIEETTDCTKPSTEEKVYDNEGHYLGVIKHSPCEE